MTSMNKPELALVVNQMTSEDDRLQELHGLGILDTPREESFDRIVKLAALIFDVPIALITLLDDDRQWFKAGIGIDACETPRDQAFCSHAIVAGDDIFEVLDAALDPVFLDNPLVTGPPNLRYYAGKPLVMRSGARLGTLCLVDIKPRAPLSEQHRIILRSLSELVVREIKIRALGRDMLGMAETVMHPHT